MIICTRCNTRELNENSQSNTISLRDNKTMICNLCGDEERKIDYQILTLGHHPEKGNEWWDDWARDAKFQLMLGPDIAAKYCRELVISLLGDAPDEPIISRFLDEIQHLTFDSDGGDR